MVGVNGDFYADSGRPSGVLMRDGIVESPPYGDRSSVGVTAEGGLDVRRVEFFGTWRGLGQRRTLNDLNQAPGPNGDLALHAELRPGDAGPGPAHGGRDLPVPADDAEHRPRRPVIQVATRRRHADPAGRRRPRRARHRGAAARRGGARRDDRRPAADLPARVDGDHERRRRRPGARPRAAAPVFRAQEAFTSSQLAPRNPRTGVGQLADGRVLMVVTDGRRPGYSVGMTNFELAQTMVRLGAVTGSALRRRRLVLARLRRARCSTARPTAAASARSRPRSSSCTTASSRPPEPVVISPNGDGDAEKQRELTYKVVRPSNVTATLVAPGGASPSPRRSARAGHVSGRVPARAADPTAPPRRRGPLAARRRRDRRPRPDLDDDAGVHGQQHARLRAALAPLARRPRPRQADDRGRRDADAAGARDRDRRDEDGRPGRDDRRPPPPGGPLRARWKGTTRGGTFLVYGGMYVVRFRADERARRRRASRPPFRVIRAAPVPKKKPKPRG